MIYKEKKFFQKMFIVTEYAALTMLIHTKEKPYCKSIHKGEEPYIYDFIIVRLI